MGETNSRHTVMKHFRELGAECQRIEDSLRAGIPDLNVLWCPGSLTDGPGCTPSRYRSHEGWLEFKFVSSLPKRGTTPVRIGLRPEQCTWLTLRATAGGRVGVITKLDPRRMWLVHTGHFRALRDGMPVEELCSSADMCWVGDFKSRAHDVLKLVLGC